MNILILGGTGAMGVHLVKILSENKDNHVFVTSRSERKKLDDKVICITGNAKDNAFLDSVLKKERWDAIVDFMVYSTDEFKSRVEKILISCGHYIFLSSSRVYANSKTPIKEDSPRLLEVCKDAEYLSTDEYALAKARQENILFECGYKNWTIVRPYITYSENRLQLGVLEKEFWLYSALNAGGLVFSKDIAGHTTTLTYGYDVARGIAALVGKKDAYTETFHITGDRAIGWQSVFEIYAEVLRKHGIIFDEIMKDKSYRLSGNAKYQVLYDRYYDRIFDNSKIAHFIDMESFVSPESGLRKCLDKFLERPSFLYIDMDGLRLYLAGTEKNIPFSCVNGWKNKVKFIFAKMNLR